MMGVPSPAGSALHTYMTRVVSYNTTPPLATQDGSSIACLLFDPVGLGALAPGWDSHRGRHSTRPSTPRLMARGPQAGARPHPSGLRQLAFHSVEVPHS